MKYTFHIIIAAVVILFFGRIAYNGYHHHQYSVAYEKQCHEKGGVRVTTSTGKGWAQYVCLQNENVISMGALESGIVKRPHEDVSENG